MIDIKVLKNGNSFNFITTQNLKVKFYKKNDVGYNEKIGESFFIGTLSYTPTSDGLYTFEFFEAAESCSDCPKVSQTYYVNQELRESFLDTVQKIICNETSSTPCDEFANPDNTNCESLETLKSLSFYYLQDTEAFLYAQSAFVCISNYLANINSSILLDEKILGKSENVKLLRLILSFHYYVIYLYELNTNIDTDWVKSTYRENTILCCLQTSDLPIDCIEANLNLFSKHTSINTLEKDVFIEVEEPLEVATDKIENKISIKLKETWIGTVLAPLIKNISDIFLEITRLSSVKDMTELLICYDDNKIGFLKKYYNSSKEEIVEDRKFTDVNGVTISTPPSWSYGVCIPESDPQTPITYTNVQLSGTAEKNNCLPGETGSVVTYVVAAGTYSSQVSQAEADQLALNDIANNKQTFANDNGVCVPDPATVFENELQSQEFTKNDCGLNETGSVVLYSVPAGTYQSTVSQEAANQLALNDITQEGQNYANLVGNCVLEIVKNSSALIEVLDCDTNSGLAVQVYSDSFGDSVGDKYYVNSDSSSDAPFLGENKKYRITASINAGNFIDDFSQTIVSQATITINNLGVVTSVDTCNTTTIPQ